MYFLLALLCISFSSFCSQEITGANVFTNHKVGNIKLHHKNDNFFVEQDGHEHQIKKHWMDPELRKISKKQLNAFLGKGYFAVNKLENGEFTLKAKVRGNGGGPTLGLWVYWGTKSICYGTLATGLGVAATATGGLAVGALGGSAAASVVTGGATAAMSSTVAATALGTATGATGATVIAGAIGGSATATVLATEVTVATLTTAPVAATMAGIEALALTLGALAGMTPTV